MTEKICDGCEKQSDNLIALDDSQGNTIARVCHGRTYSRPSEACIGKAILRRARKSKCLICGTENGLYFSGVALRPICKECELLIAQVKGEKSARETYGLPKFKMFGNPLPMNSHIDYDTIAHAFTKALAGDVRLPGFANGSSILPPKNSLDSLNGGDAWVRLTPAQADGVREFVTAFAELVEKVEAAGKEAGGALLVQLARGEVSIDDYNDGQKPKRKR